MFTFLGFFLVSAFFELTVHLFSRSSVRRRQLWSVLAIISMLLSILSGLHLLLSVTGILLVALYAYRIFNVGRILKARMHYTYLRASVFRTSLMLIFLQLMLWIAYGLLESLNISYSSLLYALLLLELLAAYLFIHTADAYARQSVQLYDAPTYSNKELPTVTVAVPARNETDELQECLQSLVSSTYPKLEIVVLDDCSQSARTPDIIRSFAHDGVRFIQGLEPHETWLSKNQAYAAMADASSGEVLLFAGVDIRVQPDSISRLISYMMQNELSMASLVPLNTISSNKPLLLQPMRYFLELAFPKWKKTKPATLSSCWVITRKALQQSGGFDAVKRMIIPETYFAGETSRSRSYALLAGGQAFGIQSQKSFVRQRDTAIRTAYPRFHRRPENVAFVSLAAIIGIILPLSLIIAAFIDTAYRLHGVLAAVLFIMLFAAQRKVLLLGYGKARLKDIVIFPYAALLAVSILHYSMYKYEFDEVIWRGRNVCIPAMHVVPRLPGV